MHLDNTHDKSYNMNNMYLHSGVTTVLVKWTQP